MINVAFFLALLCKLGIQSDCWIQSVVFSHYRPSFSSKIRRNLLQHVRSHLWRWVMTEKCLFSFPSLNFNPFRYDPNVPPVIPVNDTRSDWGFHPLEMSTSNYIPEITEVDDVKRTISMPVVSVKVSLPRASQIKMSFLLLFFFSCQEWKDPRIKVTLKYNNTRKLISEAFFQQCVW